MFFLRRIVSFVQVLQHAAVVGGNRQTYDDVRDPPGHGFVPQQTPGSTVTRAVSQHFKKKMLVLQTGNSGHLTWVRHSSRKTSASHSYLCVQYFRVSEQLYDCQCLGLLTCADMLIHAIAQGGCTDTVRQSALEVDSGRKIPCRTGDSNPRQYYAWLFT